ncbi:12802_t:CDS:2 [Funneliformis geosporum]|uniref:12802_t:CDS:1 n=1 Tax=Funneliformis geosporum TaxID=1117311 RepID=A0A9W4SUI1_9GLOM|nr:12802_t:CDS:2 [Funneliformis geosporum]
MKENDTITVARRSRRKEVPLEPSTDTTTTVSKYNRKKKEESSIQPIIDEILKDNDNQQAITTETVTSSFSNDNQLIIDDDLQVSLNPGSRASTPDSFHNMFKSFHQDISLTAPPRLLPSLESRSSVPTSFFHSHRTAFRSPTAAPLNSSSASESRFTFQEILNTSERDNKDNEKDNKSDSKNNESDNRDNEVSDKNYEIQGNYEAPNHEELHIDEILNKETGDKVSNEKESNKVLDEESHVKNYATLLNTGVGTKEIVHCIFKNIVLRTNKKNVDLSKP